MIVMRLLMAMFIAAGINFKATRSYADSFSPQDLEGFWSIHRIVTGDAPVDDPRWGYGSVTISGSGSFTVTWTTPTHTAETSSGSMFLSGNGAVTVVNNPAVNGLMNPGKDLIVIVDSANDTAGNALMVMVKQGPETIFSPADLSGAWYGYQVVSGDRPDDDPRWGYGAVNITNTGGFTGVWTSPTSLGESINGSIQITNKGITTLNNQPLTHGVMNGDKDFLVFTDGSGDNGGNGFIVMVKRRPGIIFDTSDFAGKWWGFRVVSGDEPDDDPRWGYGPITIDASGTFEVVWTNNYNQSEYSTGSIGITSDGIINIANQTLITGAMSDNKEFVVFIDGTADTQGNAITLMVKTVSPVGAIPAQNLLLLGIQ